MQGQAQLLAMHEAQHMLKNLACTLLNSLPLKGYICKSVSLLEVCDSDSHTQAVAVLLKLLQSAVDCIRHYHPNRPS